MDDLTTEEKLVKLLKKLQKDYTTCKSMVDTRYDKDIYEGRISGRPIEQAISNTVNLMMDWAEAHSIVKGLVSDSELGAETSFQNAYYKLKKHSNEDYNSTEAKILASCDPMYRKFKLLHTRSKKLMTMCETMMDTLESVKYMLKDYTSLIIEGATEYEIAD